MPLVAFAADNFSGPTSELPLQKFNRTPYSFHVFARRATSNTGGMVVAQIDGVLGVREPEGMNCRVAGSNYTPLPPPRSIEAAA